MLGWSGVNVGPDISEGTGDTLPGSSTMLPKNILIIIVGMIKMINGIHMVPFKWGTELKVLYNSLNKLNLNCHVWGSVKYY